MLQISEKIVSGGTLYEKWLIDSTGRKTLLKAVRIKASEVENENGERYMLLYDSNMQVIREVFRYINFQMSEQSPNSKNKALHALKLFFMFIELFDIDYKNITLKQAKELKYFLYGSSPKGVDISFNIETNRSSDTINSYLGVYRKFFEFMLILESPFYQKNIVKIKNNIGFSAHMKRIEEEEYTLSDNSQRDYRKVPMYIKPNEFSSILKTIRESFTLREEVIVRLMFECGMRIGEVLGLTLEDIETSPEEINSKNYDELGCVIIRNRLTDKRYQLAKGCYIPRDIKDYRTRHYSTEHTGYQKVYPTISLLFKIDEYIQEAHEEMSDRNRENYLKDAKADMITNGESLSGENSYLFLNKNGTRLSKSGWNEKIRDIFLKSGLKIDIGIRKHNLNHRFRHGYAMYLKKYQNATELDLMYALRHSSPASCSTYFRPDDDDIYQANLQATESMYKLIPDLRY